MSHRIGSESGQRVGAATRWLAAMAMSLLILAAPAGAQDEVPLVPEPAMLSDPARAAIDAQWLTPEERSAMRVFHGVWDDADLQTPTLRAMVALNAWEFNDPSLSDETVPVEIRAEAKLKRGELREAIDLLAGATSNRAARIRAEAWEGLGDLAAADRAVDPAVSQLLKKKIDDASELTEGVRALFVRARVQGQPARHYQTMMGLLGRAHQELDRLYWPSALAESQLLLDKDNANEAIDALHETLSLNPRCAEAWYALGQIAMSRFDFDSVQAAATTLRQIRRDHPLAGLLLAESRMIQDDPDEALAILEPIMARWPKLRPGLALLAAAFAVRFDEEPMRTALAGYDALSPGSAQAYFLVGKHLSFQRQYEEAAQMLEEAVKRQPAWPAPQIELGLLELQSGREGRALAALRNVAELDPYNKRAANSLLLLDELAGYHEIESEHFIIRYMPGIDQVFAELLPEELERIHAVVAGRFEHEPDRKTIIEVLPDHERFSVRITGMPWIHTIAACTGPVIALEVPREGPESKHLGTFDWPRVIQHEYTHTITLSQTRNRIPHWLTEAAAVSMEGSQVAAGSTWTLKPSPRDYDRCLQLARAFADGELFDMEEINWAFIRPRHANDRSLAYAQGDWMVQYINERFGSSALIRLVDRYYHGVREEQAMRESLGISRDEFVRGFLVWAGEQVKSWGLAAKPTMDELTDELRMADPQLAEFMNASRQARLDMIAQALTERIGAPSRGRALDRPFDARQWPQLVRPPVEVDDETLARWRGEYPEHPDLLEMDIRRRIDRGENDEQLVALLNQYAAIRPTDPFPHARLAHMLLSSDHPADAIPHLERLDSHEQKSTVYAIELANQYRANGDVASALRSITRAVNINPYHAPTRELAAAIALQAGRLDLARRHIFALTLIEPNRPQHVKRLERIDAMIAAGPAQP